MIIVLVGRLGSGKSKLAKYLVESLDFRNFHFIEVSDLVKEIIQSQNRSSLVRESLHRKQEDPMWLAEPLRQKLVAHKNWVVSGVRELVLLDTIRDLGQKVHVVRLTCDDKVRLKRCKDKFKTLSELRAADEVDNGLGLLDVLASVDCELSTSSTLKQTKLKLLNLVETMEGLD